MIKLTQKQADYLESFRNDKKLAFYHIGRWGFGYNLKDGNAKVYADNKETPFTYEEKEKMLNALINGYEVIEPKFIFYNFSDISGNPLYYNGTDEVLTKYEEEALEVEIDSEEYKALERLGFCKREV